MLVKAVSTCAHSPHSKKRSDPCCRPSLLSHVRNTGTNRYVLVNITGVPDPHVVDMPDTAAAIVCTIVASIYSMVFVTVIIGSSSVFTFVVKISDKFKRETFCELLFMVLLVIPSILLILGFALGGVMALCET